MEVAFKVVKKVNRKQLNILKTFLEYLEFYIVIYWRWFSPKICLTNYILRASCLWTGCSLEQKSVLGLKNKIIKKKKETKINTKTKKQNLGVIWWQTLGGEYEVTKFCHSFQQIWLRWLELILTKPFGSQ